MLIQRLFHRTTSGQEEVCTIYTSKQGSSIKFADRDLESHFRLFGISIPKTFRESCPALKNVSWVSFPDGSDAAVTNAFISAFQIVELSKPSYANYSWSISMLKDPKDSQPEEQKEPATSHA